MYLELATVLGSSICVGAGLEGMKDVKSFDIMEPCSTVSENSETREYVVVLEYLQRNPKSPLCETVKAKPESQW